MPHRLLHFLPPEAAHRLTLWGLKLGLGATQPAHGTPISLFGKTLRGRIGLAGGADKNAEALAGWQKIGFAFVEIGTVTLKAREGNPKPRIWRQEKTQSLINWMGLPGQGADAVARHLAAFRATEIGEDFCVGASIASPSGVADELCEIASKLHEHVDFFTLNASCPNVTAHEGKSVLETIVQHLKAAIAGAGGKPILVKLAPTVDEDNLHATCRLLATSGAAGFIACNTLPNTSANMVDATALPKPWPQHNGAPVGGYSGPALLSISLLMVRTIREAVGNDKVIIGVGGITSPQDAKEMLKNGADLVQLYTALTYQGTPLLKHINEEIG
ncbi:MAG: dihydroorotate dehydrogenase 2 [Alphaproteobacteria bacterium]|nr:dihydroorotate dehydrogenase 2 [Alphaproteobacteria bacterium]